MGAGTGADGGSLPGVKPGVVTALLQLIVAAPEQREAEPAPLAPGTVVGRFEILGELGRGAFGAVYEARDRELGRMVALKVVRPGTAAPGEAQVLQEAEAIARLSHPNLVTLHDAGRSEGGLPYLVFELLRGRTLEERLDRGPMPTLEAVHVAVEVARGLAHAHAEGVVHRDLKPANVFLTTKGQVKVLDFGMAHAFGRQRLSGGTPAYMAPEQWTEGPEDERTDVFALGVMLHRMISGGYPFGANGGRWSSGTATAAKLEVPGVPGLEELVGRMLTRAPEGRPRDGAAVLEALAPLEEALRTLPSGEKRSSRPRRAAALLVSAGLLVAMPGVAWYAWKGTAGQGAATPPAPPSVAVLAFTDMSPLKDQEHLSDGIAEEILNVLTRVEGLKVVGRTSSFFFKGRDVEPGEIGRTLGVTSILEGSVRTDGNRIRVSAQLVNALDGSRLWSESYDREVGAAFAIQDDVARDVAKALRVKLLRTGRERRPATQEAYAQYRLAYQKLRLAVSDDDLRSGIETLEAVVRMDPGYAPAWAFLATSLPVILSSGHARPEMRQAGWDAAGRAIALAPDDPDGYSARAWLRMAFDLDWAGARADLERALRLNPSDQLALGRLAMVQNATGLEGEAVRTVQRAVEIDPLSPDRRCDLGNLLLQTGDLQGAREAAGKALEIAPSPIAERILGVADLLEGKADKVLERALRQEDAADRLFLATLAEHGLGHPEASARARAEYASRFGPQHPWEVARVMAWSGRPDEAFAWMDRSLDTGGGYLICDVRNDPLIRGLHSDLRWKGLLGRANLPVD